MADDLHNPGPEDGKLISLKEPHEIAYWRGRLACTRAELEAAVAAVGHSAQKVEEYLGQYEGDTGQDDNQAEGDDQC
jgi:hypothetical protein